MPDLKTRLTSLAYPGNPEVFALIEKTAVGIHANVPHSTVVEGLGFEGDHDNKDWWNGKRISEREVTAVSSEILEELGCGVAVTGDNIVTKGIDLSTLKAGDRLRIGNVVLRRAVKNHRPCSTFARRISDEARFAVSELNLRGALFAVESGGRIAPGDSIVFEHST